MDAQISVMKNMNIWNDIRKNNHTIDATKDIDIEIYFHQKRIQTINNLQKNIPKSSPLFKFRTYLKQRHLREIKKLNKKKHSIKL
jgi:hypothetical protein